MKIFRVQLFALLLFTQSATGQTTFTKDTVSKKISDLSSHLDSVLHDPCIIASDSAKTQAQKGNYSYTREGLIRSSDFETFYSNYVKNKYGLTLLASCVSPPDNWCFAWTANRLAEDKFGKDFLIKMSMEAELLYKK